MRTRIKICGITRLEDLQASVAAGADALGFVFHVASPRALTVDWARLLALAVPPFVSRVALFMDADPGLIREVLAKVPVDLLQFHGSEPAAECESHGRPYIKAIPMGGGSDAAAYAAEHRNASGFLLDAHMPGAPGGTGQTFDWTSTVPRLGKPLILAGGLHPGNVAQAVRLMQPYGVDVSSGVESAKGIKDAAKLSAFCTEVFRADGHQ